jgi:hypothetical protein
VPLQKKVIDIPFATGIDQKSDQRWVEQGYQTSVINGQFVKKNAIRKRPGFNNLTKSTIPSGALLGTAKLCSYKNEVISIDGDWLYSYSPTEAKHLQVDQVSECVGYRTGIACLTDSVNSPDVAELNGFRIFTWQTGAVASGQASGNVYASVLDTTTGNYVVFAQRVATASVNPAPRVVFTSNASNGVVLAFVIWFDSSSSKLRYSTWNPSTPSVSFTAPADLVTGVTGKFDVCPVVGDINGRILAIYEVTGGANRVNLLSFHPGFSPVSFNSNFVDANTGFTAMAIRANVETSSGSPPPSCWCAFSYTSGGNQFIDWGTVTLRTAGVETLTTSAINTISLGNVQPVWTLGIENFMINQWLIVAGTPFAGTSTPENIQYWMVSQTIVLNTFGTTWYLYPVSKPFTRLNAIGVPKIYCHCLITESQSTTTPAVLSAQTQCLFDLQVDIVTSGSASPRPVATIGPRISGAINSNHVQAHTTAVTNPGVTNADTYNLAGCVIVGSGFQNRLSVVQVTLDYKHPGRWISVEIGDSLFLGGGVPCFYDGGIVAEAGYLYTINPFWFPVPLSPSAGGNLTNTGSPTYSWVFLYEWTDTRGQVHRSQASPPVSVQISAGSGNYQVTFKLPYLTVGNRFEQGDTSGLYANNFNSVSIVPYRTAVVGGTMSVDFYRALSPPDTIPTALKNIASANPTTSYTDGLADSNITSNAVWLGSSDIGVVEPQCPPSFVCAWGFQGRIMGIGDDQQTLWFSTKSILGEPVRFNDLLTIVVQNMGPVIAGTQLDDKCVLFSKSKIAFFTGDGPNDTNQQNDFSPLSFLQSDVGCIDPRSLVATPLGIMFQSSKGIYLLSRSLEVSYVGKAIEDTLALYSTVTSAVLVSSQNEVRFTLNGTDATTLGLGYTARYNFLLDAWSLDSIFDSDKSKFQQQYSSAVVANGTYYCSTYAGQIYQETPGSFTDGGSFVSTSIESSWLKPAGIQGWGRIWRFYALTEKLDSADLTLQIGYDYAATYTDKIIWANNQLADFATPLAQVQIMPSRQKAEAMRVRLSDSTPSAGASITTGQGMNFIGLSAEVGVYPVGYRLPAVQKG